MADLRVIYLVNPRTAIEVPELLVRFRCPKCNIDVVLDAYDGPPVCQIHRVVLEGISVMREPAPAVIVDLDEGAAEKLQQDSRDKGGASREATEAMDAMFGEETPR